MKKIIVSLLFAAAALSFTGCAKYAPSGANDANKRYFDAWRQINYPDATRAGFGIYIIEEEEGSGTTVAEGGYALIDYVTTDLQGNISLYTDEETARKLGKYQEGNYYGPKFQNTTQGAIPVGFSQALTGMKIGGHKKVVVPAWLISYKDFDSEEEYLAESTSASNTIYDIRVKDFTTDIIGWQIDSIGRYFKENSSIFGTMTAADSLENHKGFYYKQTELVRDTTSFPKDTTIYINYTGRLLDGTVFDTTDERLAKDNGIWSSSRTYEPVQINWGETYTDITMGSSSSSIIDGFALTLWQMRKFEKGIGVFTSDYGYGYSGSGESIPPFASLAFEIEIVAKPE